MSGLIYSNNANRCVGWTNNIPSLAPHIDSLSGYISIYQYQTIITIFGYNFRSYSIVRFGIYSLSIQFLNANQISFYVPSSAVAGTYTVQVFNDSVGSNVVTFDIASISGPTGTKGPTGNIGPTGAPGGVTGAQGVQGVTGIQGTTGPQGATGIRGVTGAQGVQGVTGIQGTTGVQGATGPQGSTGVQGVTGPQGASNSYWGLTGGNTALYNTNQGGALLLNSSISLYGGTTGIYTDMSYNRLGYSYTNLFGGTGNNGVEVGGQGTSNASNLYINAGQLIIGDYGVYMITCQCNIICNEDNGTIIDSEDIIISTNPGGVSGSGNTQGGVPLTPYGFRYFTEANDSVNVTGLRYSTTLSGVLTVNSGLTGTGSVGDTGYGLPIYINSTCPSSNSSPFVPPANVYLNGGISATRIA